MLSAQRIEHFGWAATRYFLGVFLLVMGVVGAVSHILPYASSMGGRFLFASSVAALWVSGWLAAYRVPSTFLTFMWAGAMVALWQFKYGAMPF